MPERNAGEKMAREVQLNVGVPQHLKLRIVAAAELHEPPLTVKGAVEEALEAWLRQFNDELDEFYAISAGIVARNRRQADNTQLKSEGQR